MEKLYAVTLTDVENTSPCRTWLFDNKKTAHMFLCNIYEKTWKKHYIPDSKGNYDVVEKKSVHPFVDDYKNNDFKTGEYYNIYFKNCPEIIFGICQITPSHITTENPNINRDFLSTLGEDMKEAFDIAEQMMKNPDEITIGDIIWLCGSVGMRKELFNAKEGEWLDVAEDALRKLGYRI